MRTLTTLEQKQVSGGIITEFTYDFVEPDEANQMLLNVHLKGDEADIRNIIKGFYTPSE